MLFYTESGSIYEVDAKRSRIRKMSGEYASDWLKYLEIDVEIKKPAVIALCFLKGLTYASVTTPVTRIVGDRDIS